MQGVAGQVPDTSAVFRAAGAAEAEYEYAARQLAPLSASPRSGGRCDEIVGRFCLFYDSGRDALPAEPAEIARIRLAAIDKLQAAFALNAARRATVFPLVRLLIENGSTRDAVGVARSFREAADDDPNGSMLLVLAHHAAGEISRAENELVRWLATQDSVERRRLEDLSWLLHRRERSRYRNLSGVERTAYEARFWRYADALYMTPGNETRTEHFARHAEAVLLRSVPTVRGATGWGDDVAELTIRFGTPKARTRVWPRGGMPSAELQLIEHWDPEQLIFAPPAIDSALQVRARPRGGWPMDTVRSISGHAPSTFRRMLPLEHQANVFRNSDGRLVLRVDGRAGGDSPVTGPRHVQRALVVLDSTLTELTRVEDRIIQYGDSILLRLEVSLPDGAAFYSAELLESPTRLAARARFPIEIPASDAGLHLSHILIAEPFTPGRLPVERSDTSLLPKAVLLLARGSPFGVYAEVDLGTPGRDSVRVELELVGIDGRPALVRAANWLGRKLGLADRPPPNRLSWIAEIPESGRSAVAVTIDPGGLGRGRYFVDLTVSDNDLRRRLQARREILIY